MARTLECDYLVVGAGAMALAFVDSLVTGSTKTIAIVDRYARPGGHWTTAYPFVQLHQPAASYGVNSQRLERGGIEPFGWNKGLAECSNRDDILAYFAEVMKTFLKSGRVQYFPKADYTGEGSFRSIITGQTYQAKESSIIVDATYSRTVVPSMRPPPYKVGPDVDVVTPNNLPNISRGYDNYTVVGAGKTSMDCCLWLLEKGVEATKITWIRPRDCFSLNRAAFQPFPEVVKNLVGGQIGSVLLAQKLQDVVDAAKAHGALLQLDEEVTPTMFHCATVSPVEFEALKEIKNVIRKGRLTGITKDEVSLEQGTFRPTADTLYIDCSAGSIPKMAPVTVFQKRKITLQPVRWCQQTFSASFIGHVEATYGDDVLKNELCRPIPMPDKPMDFPLIMLQGYTNALAWMKQPQTMEWLKTCRLDIEVNATPKEPQERDTFLHEREKVMAQACQKLRELIGDLPDKEAAAQMNAELEGFPPIAARL